jgi:hypothetical protein
LYAKVIETNRNHSKEYRTPTNAEKETILSSWSEYFADTVRKEKKVFGTCACYGLLAIALLLLAILCLLENIIWAIVFGVFSVMCLIGPIPLMNEWKKINDAYKDLKECNFMIMEAIGTDFHMEQTEAVDGSIMDEAYVDAVDSANKVIARSVLIPFDWAERFVKSGIVYQFPIFLIKIDGYDRLLAIAL